ncbi:hypothetical protein, partial [Pseudomonas shahriarae]|uniref:hypothetical protein n=1 Tax=Pseudomonas shahriarae TaxID=2745512 RepID=UPI0023622D78
GITGRLRSKARSKAEQQQQQQQQQQQSQGAKLHSPVGAGLPAMRRPDKPAPTGVVFAPDI